MTTYSHIPFYLADEERPVGYLNRALDDRVIESGFYKFFVHNAAPALIGASLNDLAEAEITVYSLAIKTRRLRVARYEVNSSSLDLTAFARQICPDIPPCVIIGHDLATDSFELSWPSIVIPDFKTYQVIFNSDDFVPFAYETYIDPDQLLPPSFSGRLFVKGGTGVGGPISAAKEELRGYEVTTVILDEASGLSESRSHLEDALSYGLAVPEWRWPKDLKMTTETLRDSASEKSLTVKDLLQAKDLLHGLWK